MKHILRRFLTRDPLGRPLAVQSERLSDDGRGRLQLSSERTAGWCPGCRRPIADLNELRGVCDCCGTRGTCVHCASQCQVCSRRLCGRCRRGFAGPPALTVCPICRQRLLERQALRDRLLLQRAALERELARRRQSAQLQAMHLAAGRLRVSAEIQAARLRLQRDLAMTREMNRLRLAVAQLSRHGPHALR